MNEEQEQLGIEPNEEDDENLRMYEESRAAWERGDLQRAKKLLLVLADKEIAACCNTGPDRPKYGMDSICSWMKDGAQVKDGGGMNRRELIVSWGDGVVVRLRPSEANWAKIDKGQRVEIEGGGYSYEGETFLDVWSFNCDGPGTLRVSYDDGDGFVGCISDALADS
jgi:hypothetical protein